MKLLHHVERGVTTPDARVAPVPVLGAGHDGLLPPVLVVVPDAVGDLVYFAIDGEVDDGLGVGDRVGPE